MRSRVLLLAVLVVALLFSIPAAVVEAFPRPLRVVGGFLANRRPVRTLIQARPVRSVLARGVERRQNRRAEGRGVFVFRGGRRGC